MYEHPIKRAGLTMNRIIYSNSKILMTGQPKFNPQQYILAFKNKTFENGKAVKIQGKSSCLKPWHFFGYELANFILVFTSDQLDDVLPARKWAFAIS